MVILNISSNILVFRSISSLKQKHSSYGKDLTHAHILRLGFVSKFRPLLRNLIRNGDTTVIAKSSIILPEKYESLLKYLILLIAPLNSENETFGAVGHE